MNKKLLSGLAIACCAIGVYGQTIVSTNPENRKVILEEFTGINCTFCPDGHAIAQAIKDEYPEDVFLINIHTGGFATPNGNQPDFRTDFGDAIAGQSGLVGYPAGTVNRQVFEGSSQSGNPDDTAMSRGAWAAASEAVIDLPSYLNMAVEADVDVQERTITVHVEAYYTGDSPEATNLLNVALLQNNTLGPQVGGNMGDAYVHQHRLVHMITGQWGEEIATTTTGSFIDRTYTYEIPADYRDIEVLLGDLEVVVFMTETQQFIISGNGALPTFSNFEFSNDIALTSVADLVDICDTTIAPSINVSNMGENDITAFTVEYSVNDGDTQTYDWTGTLSSFQNVDVELPEVTIELLDTNTLNVFISEDDNTANNTASVSFDKAPGSTGEIYMELNTDNWGSEVTWNVVDGAGTVVYSGGPYGNNQTINETFELEAGCHTFNLFDSYGDGGGAVTLTDSNGVVVYSTNGDYGSGEFKNFDSDGTLSAGSFDTVEVVMYPNPANSVVNVRNAEGANLIIYDILGKELLTRQDIDLEESVDVSSLAKGTYFVQLRKDGVSSTQKLIIAE